MKKLLFALLTPLVVFGQVRQLPDVAAVEFTTNSNASKVGVNYVLGYQFTVKSPITLTRLGAVLQDPTLHPVFGKLPASMQVGLWDASQNLLASATVTTTHPMSGHFHYAPVTSVQLLPGVNYTVAGLVPKGYSALADVPTVMSGAQVEFGAARSFHSDTLAYPAGDVLATPKNFLGASFTYAGGADPVAMAGADQSVLTGGPVALDGSGSFSGSGAVSYQWTLVSGPAQSSASLAGANTANPSFVPDLEGIYVAQLVVSDGLSLSPPSTVTITARRATPKGPQTSLPVANQ